MDGIRLQEKTALFCGPFNRNLQSLAHNFTQLGCDVILACPDGKAAERFCAQLSEAREISEKYGRAMGIAAEIKSRADAQDLVSKAAQYFGGVDILVDANGLVGTKSFADSMEQIDLVCDRNLRSTLLVTNAVLPFLKGRKKGRILYLLDGAVVKGSGCDSLSIAMRSALIGFTKALAAELREFHITVNCVSVGLAEEFLTTTSPPGMTIQAALKALQTKNPEMSITDPERVSATVSFLASSLASGMTGQVLELV